MANRSAEKNFILEFIAVYRSLPALWDVTSRSYTNRVKKNEQYIVLVEKYREKFPNADKHQVIKKINSLRTNFRKELKRIREAEERGEYAESSLWYFEEMKFLTSQETPTIESVYYTPEAGNEDNDTNDVYTMTQARVAYEPPTTKYKKEDPTDTFDRMASKCLHEPFSPPDDYDKLAAVWAAELRKMDPHQQILAKKGINDILFEGQMGTLHRHSVEINATRSSTPISM